MGSTITERLGEIRRRIARAALRCGREPGNVRLLAVSKLQKTGDIREAVSAGQTFFGENYVQEAKEKIEALDALRDKITWHFIGHLQSNKAKLAVRLFRCIETLDSLKLARALDRHAREAGVVLPVLVQVNIAGDPAKSGLPPEELEEFLREISGLSNIAVEGLMTMPPWSGEPEDVRPWFRALRKLRDRMRAVAIPGIRMGELSMGMSHDFEVAVEEGATIVRVGTGIFGPRT